MPSLLSIQKRSASRLIIFPKDVMIVTGKSYRTGCAMLNTIRRELGKKRHQCVTIIEFCEYMGLEEELVRAFLSG